jgi:hypothetical protein
MSWAELNLFFIFSIWRDPSWGHWNHQPN